jgi:hypothetical protein
MSFGRAGRRLREHEKIDENPLRVFSKALKFPFNALRRIARA